MFALAPVLILALAGASPSPAPTALPTVSPALMKLAMPSYTPSTSHISVKAGQPFQIRMQVTSGTGYSWQPAGPMAPGLAFEGTFQQPHGKMMPGGPGVQILVFRAQSTGVARVTLEYLRPWERSAKPAKTQTFTVSVHG